jgi:hypothetical protein
MENAAIPMKIKVNNKRRIKVKMQNMTINCPSEIPNISNASLAFFP